MDKAASPDSDPIKETAFNVDDESLKAKHRSINVNRGLTPRHIQLFAIGGVIGTGLFVGIAEPLTTSGPLSSLLGFIVYCVNIWCIAQCVGEMVCYLPVQGSFVRFAGRFVDVAFMVATGFNYAYGCLTFVCAEASAIAGLFEYWWPHISPAVWVSIFLVTVFLINAFAVKAYGEFEFWFSSFKVLLILGLLLMTFIMMVGGNPHNDKFGFRTWSQGDLMKEYIATGSWGQFLGFWNTFVFAAFAIGGPEFVGMCAPEAIDPRRTIAKAIRRVIYRIFLFYILGVLAAGILCGPNDPDLLAAMETGKGSASSPFVIGMKKYGINVLPDIVNAVVITSAWSCGTAFCFTAVRILNGLALDGVAPKLFKWTFRGVPMYALIFAIAIGCLSYMVVDSGSLVVFNWFLNLAAISSLINQGGICFTYLRFYYGMRKQGMDRNKLPFKGLFQPYTAYFGLIFVVIVIITNGFAVWDSERFNVSDFMSAYFGAFLAIFLFTAWKLIKRTKFVTLEEMDLTTGVAEIDSEEEQYAAARKVPVTLWEKFVDWLF